MLLYNGCMLFLLAMMALNLLDGAPLLSVENLLRMWPLWLWLNLAAVLGFCIEFTWELLSGGPAPRAVRTSVTIAMPLLAALLCVVLLA